MPNPIFKSIHLFSSKVNFALIAFLTFCSFFLSQVEGYGQCVPGETVTVTYSSIGNGTFIIPSGVTSVRVQVWGAGGRGGTRSSDGEGGGGGGGAYSESTLSVSSGDTYFYSVGAGSTSESRGGNSWFSTNNNISGALVLATGGESAENNDDDGAEGGNRNDGIGDIRFSGGDGGDGDGNDGGGGGSSGSPSDDGEDGEDGDDGSDGGQANGDGGDGGNGQESNDGNGFNGQNPGGGGGGATRRNNNQTYTGGAGGDGQVIISYVCPTCGPSISYSSVVQQFTVPAGITSISAEAWGGGGRGGTRSGNDGGAGGGGAGAYSASTAISVTPGEILYYRTGAGSLSSASPGQDSWLSRNSDGSSPLILAKGGASISGNNITSGAAGGLAVDGVGVTKIDGGNGDNAGNGNNGDGGDGGDSPNGGNGGLGGNGGNSEEIPGEDGESPGGGGGGAKTGENDKTEQGGNGGNGLIKITYSCDNSNPPPSGCWRYIDDGSVSGVVIIEFFDDCTWEAPEGLLEFEVLVVGGGGGGGLKAGGGGGGGGLVHARALVEETLSEGLPANSVFSILVGDGGNGSTDRDNRGENGTRSSFDLGESYEIIAGGGGGGGSDGSGNIDEGAPGDNSSIATTTGLEPVNSMLLNGSDGGAAHNEDNPDGSNGGNGDSHSGGGGGGADGNGENAPNNENGGDGGDGLSILDFDNRIYAAGGGGGGRNGNGGDGGSSPNGGGDGGDGDEEDATSGQAGQSPGSGGGGTGDGDEEDVDGLSGGNGAKGVVIVRYEIARILPVEYLYFNAKYNSFLRSGDLTWATAKEWENDRFEVERSVNNVTAWEKIGVIDGAGYSDGPIDYDYQDLKLPVAGGNIFYRLKQVDFDGEFSFSDTKSIKVEALPGTTQWRIFPNPTTGYPFNIEILDPSAYRDEPVTLRAISPTGQYEFIQVDDIREMGAQVSNYFEQKASGVYTIEIAWGAKREYHKVILKR
ncbi:MAG: hypothetical protein P8O16_12640 [Algoriphagus sp.]|uniref:glycine-rich domain-containing protein n=1 Tax=Algoriphagus sp. TaxID=1872435 RepID=UPI00261D59A9|nr:hypothetical protein [Algoriphagus sp.]MDG1278122.1 hypothetical protein [Algoriphagus sp.]